MICNQYRELASAEMDDELTEIEQAEIQEHREHCVVCRQYKERLLAAQETLTSINRQLQPENLHLRIRARISVETESRSTGLPAPVILDRHGIPIRRIPARQDSKAYGLWGRNE